MMAASGYHPLSAKKRISSGEEGNPSKINPVDLYRMFIKTNVNYSRVIFFHYHIKNENFNISAMGHHPNYIIR